MYLLFFFLRVSSGKAEKRTLAKLLAFFLFFFFFGYSGERAARKQ